LQQVANLGIVIHDQDVRRNGFRHIQSAGEERLPG
jgi:hypothetical protein